MGSYLNSFVYVLSFSVLLVAVKPRERHKEKCIDVRGDQSEDIGLLWSMSKARSPIKKSGGGG